MRVLNLFSFFSILFLLVSCGEKEDRTVEVDETVATQVEFQDPNEAIDNWTVAWNSNDPSQIQALTADDAVVVIDGHEMPKDSIASFIQEGGSIMKNLKTTSLKKGSNENFAYDTGTYTHTYTTDTTQQYQGSYTFIWERTNDESEWRVKAMNITNAQPEGN